jgi:hypothetical protein
MSDTAQAPRRLPIAAILTAGLASGLLYASMLLAFAFLLPVQVVFGRYGRREGLAAAGVAAVGVLAAQLWGFRPGAGGLGALDIAVGALPALVLLAALLIINAPFWGARVRPYKILAVAAACALAALPLLLALERDTSIASFLEGRIGSILAPLSASVGDSYEASALAASLDPKEVVATSMTALRDSFAAIILAVIGGSWRIGNRLSGPLGPGREETLPIEAFKLPFPLVWAFLGSWSLVLATVLLHAAETPSAFAWNCAIAVSLLFAAQGWGIATHLFKSWNVPRSLRIITGVMAIIALVTPTAGYAVAAGLPLLGVTETWIPYRKPKGAGA